jgi:hypothetical protein
MPLGGTKDKHFYCFHSSCQLQLGLRDLTFEFSYDKSFFFSMKTRKKLSSMGNDNVYLSNIQGFLKQK